MTEPTLAPETKDKNTVPLPTNAAAYTLVEAAIILRRSPKTVRRLIERGKLRRDETFWRVRIPRKDVDTFLERHSTYAF